MVNVIPDTFVVDVPVTKSPWPILSIGYDLRSSTEERLGLTRSWLETCINTHQNCPPAVQKLPKRVIALDPHSSKIKLKETANGDGRYAATAVDREAGADDAERGSESDLLRAAVPRREFWHHRDVVGRAGGREGLPA